MELRFFFVGRCFVRERQRRNGIVGWTLEHSHVTAVAIKNAQCLVIPGLPLYSGPCMLLVGEITVSTLCLNMFFISYLQSSPGLIVSVRLARLSPTSSSVLDNNGKARSPGTSTFKKGLCANSGKNWKPSAIYFLTRHSQHPRWASTAWRAWPGSTNTGLRISLSRPRKPRANNQTRAGLYLSTTVPVDRYLP